MNLMMCAKNNSVTIFSAKAIKLSKELDSKLEKAIVKFTVRNYFLIHDVELYGDAQKLFDYFFGQKEITGGEKKGLRIEMAKNKLERNDRI